MYSLVRGLYEKYFSKPTFKILLVGLAGSGKTHLLTRLKMNAGQKAIEFMKIIPTIGLNIAKLELRKYNALFWDLGGAPILQSIWKKYYPDCHAIIFVVDHNYAENKEELIRTFDSVTNSEENKGVPLLILINKSDSLGDQNRPIIDEIASVLSIGLIRNRKILINSVSALRGTNVETSLSELFDCLLKLAAEKQL